MQVDPKTIKISEQLHQYNEFLPPGKHLFYFIKQVITSEKQVLTKIYSGKRRKKIKRILGTREFFCISANYDKELFHNINMNTVLVLPEENTLDCTQDLMFVPDQEAAGYSSMSSQLSIDIAAEEEDY